VARAVVALAARRQESRGAHWRADYPEPRDEWRVRQVAQLNVGDDLDVGALAVGNDRAAPPLPAEVAAV
jgi:succinate dehydrogenase/fumarate reductase flavoprotein subunit